MREVKRNLLTILPNDGPGISAFASAVDILSFCGINTMTKTSTPIPPINCVSERQKSKDFGRASTFVSMLEPVVV